MPRERSAEILLAAIKEYIRSGEPVSSGDLFSRYSFGIKPAMIRMELLDLTDQGFLEQPYHSAGRVPTDLGLKFFADEMLRGATADPRAKAWEEMLEERNWSVLLEEFSRDMGMMGILASNTFQNIYKDGLEYLFDRLEVENRAELSQVVRDIEEFGEKLARSGPLFNTDDFLEVFVGKNPLMKSRCLSVIAGDYDVGKEKVFFFAVGPKRMDYEKAAKAMKGLKAKNKVIKKKDGRTK